MRVATCHPDKQHKGKGLCKTCYARESYRTSEKYRATHRAASRRWHEKNRERARELSYLRLYGLTLAEYDQMLQDQNFTCAICDTQHAENEKLHVDHYEHKGHKVVRGLLCSGCNKAIGQLKHNVVFLQRATGYLQLNGFSH